jgi:hypothetical protein
MNNNKSTLCFSEIYAVEPEPKRKFKTIIIMPPAPRTSYMLLVVLLVQLEDERFLQLEGVYGGVVAGVVPVCQTQPLVPLALLQGTSR